MEQTVVSSAFEVSNTGNIWLCQYLCFSFIISVHELPLNFVRYYDLANAGSTKFCVFQVDGVCLASYLKAD